MRANWKRDARRRAIVPLAIVIAGLAILAFGSEVVGWTVFSVGVTLGIALVFLEVGYSEDRAREAERRRP